MNMMKCIATRYKPKTCGECVKFDKNECDCGFCCHPPVKPDQTPPWWCPLDQWYDHMKKEVEG